MENPTGSQSPNEDLKKPRNRDSVRQAAARTADLCGGTAGAAAEALKRFQTELTSTGSGSSNIVGALILGVLAGNARFFEELAKTSQRLFEEMREDCEPAKADIDYAKLAKLVALEMLTLQERRTKETTSREGASIA